MLHIYSEISLGNLESENAGLPATLYKGHQLLTTLGLENAKSR